MRWKAIPGWPHYETSDAGQIRRVTAGKGCRGANRLRKLVPHPMGYLSVKLCANNEPQLFLVHRLIALTFHGPPPPGKPQVNHKDTDKSNNRPDNLEYVTNLENMEHAIAHGLRWSPRGEERSKLLTEDDVRTIRARVAAGETRVAVGAAFGISGAQASRIADHKSWAHVK